MRSPGIWIGGVVAVLLAIALIIWIVQNVTVDDKEDGALAQTPVVQLVA